MQKLTVGIKYFWRLVLVLQDANIDGAAALE